jgi:hypothetical protein
MSGVLMYLKEYSRRLGWVHETATLDLSSMGESWRRVEG